jgi:hypothetical protein
VNIVAEFILKELTMRPSKIRRTSVDNITASTLALLLVFTFAGKVAAAESCPVTDKDIEKASSYMDAVVLRVQEAGNCNAAFRLARACQFGTSGDNQLDDIVRSKCEPLFLPRASLAIKAAYKKALRKCDRIAERNEGTMFMSFAAVCRAGAARDFAQRTGQH